MNPLCSICWVSLRRLVNLSPGGIRLACIRMERMQRPMVSMRGPMGSMRRRMGSMWRRMVSMRRTACRMAASR